MPVVKVELWEGRSKEEKEEIIKEITKVFTEQGVPKEAVTVILNETPKDNWGMGGEPASKKW